MAKAPKSSKASDARYDHGSAEKPKNLREFQGRKLKDDFIAPTSEDLPQTKANVTQSRKAEKSSHHGHRERLRQRLIKKGANCLADYEILEFLLFGANPRGDTKPLAKALIDQFGSLANVFAASDQELVAVKGIGSSALGILRCVPAAASRMIKQEVLTNPVISSWDKLLDYCRMEMGRKKVEVFRILFLDRKNRVIIDEVQQQGTVDHTSVYVREIIKRSLDLAASAIILVHNHPSGDTMPSEADIAITKEIKKACDSIGITLHDHLIITQSDHFSFKSFGLI